MKKSKGFTIIELLVVVAIISVLVVIIVFTGVSDYRNKGSNAAIKGNLATVLTNGAVYFDDNDLGGGDYDAFCANKLWKNPESAIEKAFGSGGDAVCVEKTDNTAFCACSPLKKTSVDPLGSTFCVDSRGYKKVTQNPVGCSGLGGRCSDAVAATGICID